MTVALSKLCEILENRLTILFKYKVTSLLLCFSIDLNNVEY